jgi:hypothetical protein
MVVDPGISEQRGFHALCAAIAACGVLHKVEGCELHTGSNHSLQTAKVGTEGAKRILSIGVL